jgi:hypothetical protein
LEHSKHWVEKCVSGWLLPQPSWRYVRRWRMGSQ